MKIKFVLKPKQVAWVSGVLLAAILFSYFGLQRRAWQQGAKD